MKTFLIRTGSGAVYAALVIGAVLSGNQFIGILAGVFLLLGLTEYHKIISYTGPAPHKVLFLLVNNAVFILCFLVANNYLSNTWLSGSFLLILITLLLLLFGNPVYKVSLPGYFIGFSYVTIPLSLLNFFGPLFLLQENNPLNYLVLSLFILLWINDSFAYIVGSLAGRHRLNESISPKKTWEGSLGGLLFSLIGAYVLSLIFVQMNLLQWAVFAIIVVIFGTLGDLVESVLKRKAGLKESGSLIPGHGGVLDRIDSMLLAIPFVFIYLYLIR